MEASQLRREVEGDSAVTNGDDGEGSDETTSQLVLVASELLSVEHHLVEDGVGGGRGFLQPGPRRILLLT